ncbi:hypothetical protein NQ318_003522 [Aromia moschata]|uniref:Uncharacterized protein n=1 Tax=Aromia moschata TaxID=1265417 RepID=A0AAV8YWA5_9CUCU|nr:hypothetical protein NQ318_003522 [Aromia moschata]
MYLKAKYIIGKRSTRYDNKHRRREGLPRSLCTYNSNDNLLRRFGQRNVPIIDEMLRGTTRAQCDHGGAIKRCNKCRNDNDDDEDDNDSVNDDDPTNNYLKTGKLRLA